MFVQQTVSVLLEDFLLGQQRQPPVSQSFPVLANIKVYNFEAWWNMSRLTMLEVQSPIHDIDSQGNRFVRDWSERFVIGTWLPSIFIRSSEMDPPRWQSCTNLTAPFTQSPLVAMGCLFFFLVYAFHFGTPPGEWRDGLFGVGHEWRIPGEV